MRVRRILILMAVMALFVPKVAAADVTKNDIGLLVGYIAPTTSSEITGIETKADATVDYGLQYRHKFLESNRLTLGFSALYSKFDIKVADQTVGSIDSIPILLDLNWNFLEKRSLFIGVTVGYSMWGKVDPEGGGGAVSVKDNAIYGVNLGWDINLGDHWAILTSLRYLGQKVETDDPTVPDETVDVNPVVANIGFAYRF